MPFEQLKLHKNCVQMEIYRFRFILSSSSNQLYTTAPAITILIYWSCNSILFSQQINKERAYKRVRPALRNLHAVN